MQTQQLYKSIEDTQARLIARAMKDQAFRAELVHNPKRIIEKECGVRFPVDVDVKVLEDTPTTVHVVLPAQLSLDAPEGFMDEISDLTNAPCCPCTGWPTNRTQ